MQYVFIAQKICVFQLFFVTLLPKVTRMAKKILHIIHRMIEKIPSSIFKATLTWVLLWVLIFVTWLVIQFPSIAGPLDNLSESFHVEDVYTYLTRDIVREESADVQSELVLVDVAGMESRSELATVLQELADAQPRAVALDLIFAPLSMADSAQDRQLVEALQRFPELIIASHCHSDMQGEHMERSFFADSLPHAVEGEAWLPGSVVRTFSPIIEENQRPSFSCCIARALGLNVDLTTEEQNIYYLPTTVFTWTPAKEGVNPEFLKDKVVVIGDAQDLRDFHKVPLLTSTSGRMAGVNIHMASVLTIAAERPMRHMPNGLNWLMEAILLWVLCWLFYVKQYPWLDNWYQAGVSFVMSLLLMAAGACIFAFGHYIISVLIFLLGCPLASFAKDVADWVLSKIENN